MNNITLKKLIDDLPVSWKCETGIPDISIHSIQFDSRKVQAGDLFVAESGGSVDGHGFIQAALANGAAAVVGTREIKMPHVPYIQVNDSREALAYLAASYYDHPARKMTIIGVTGTDGKTTTSNLIYQILKAAGIKAGMISTVNAVIGDKEIDTGFHVTTPEATDIQHYLSLMVDAGLTTVVLETTSHGLAQHRVTGCEYDVAVVTNITHEHLDYHGTYENYRQAKGLMFEALAKTQPKENGNLRLSILNKDDQSFEYLDSIVKSKKITYGLNGNGDLTAREIVSSPRGVDFIASGSGFEQRIHFNLPGKFNVSNCLAALAAAVSLGIDVQTAARGIAALQGVPGRMEVIEMGQPFDAIVDFAHTPNGLKRAIETAREMTRGRVIAVFGSAGLRDRQKRRMMPEVAVGLADVTILTAEDPRTESLDAILAQMADAAQAAGGIENQTFFRVPDRGEAIRLGVKLAQPGDLVIACGKGHEQSMCFETTEYPWDDRIAMRAALAERIGEEGPAMPKLPTSAK
jgi:UDP-N-acetylmuramoyl-L-alanyl-D-glutamate--2,6-diaminopimelate ligase